MGKKATGKLPKKADSESQTSSSKPSPASYKSPPPKKNKGK